MASYPVNKEHINFSRLCRAIVDLCTDVLRDILQSKINPINLMTTLAKCADKREFKPKDLTNITTVVGAGSYKGLDITMLYQILRVLFTQNLRDELKATVNPRQIITAVQNCLPLSSGPTTKLTSDEEKAVKYSSTINSYNDLKDNLLWKLYVHLCQASAGASLVHPTKPWGQNPDPGAITLGDDIERIRLLRNTVYSHVNTTQVSDAEFKQHWTSLEEITNRIDSYLSTAYKKSLDDIRVSSLDLEAEKKFFDQIKKLAEELEKNKSEVDVKVNTVKNEMEGEVTCLKAEITSVTEKQGEMSTDIAGLKTEMDTLVNTKVAQLSTNMETLREDQGTMAADTKMEFETVRAKQEAMVSDLKIEIDTVATRLQKDLGQLKTSYKDPVPEYLRERYNVQLEEWKKEDSVFVETRACVNVRKAMKEKTFVTVSGNAGSGKSAMIHHLALEYKSKGFDVIPAKDPEDIEKYLQIDQEQLFVYDDPVGIHCLNKDKFIKWLDLKIESSKMTKKLKVLFSVRRQIVNELDFKSNCNVLNKTVMDIQDDKNKLTLKEKVEMIRQHATVRKTYLCVTNSAKDIIEKQEDLFPLACELYVSSTELHKTNDWTFFQNPFKLILKDLEKMKLHDRVRYCILVLCLVSENGLDPELYSPESTVEIINDNKFIMGCELTRDSLIAGFKNGVESLVNVYLKWQNGKLSLSHDLISDVISFHFGQKYPKLVIDYFPSKFISRRFCIANSETDDPYVVRLEPKYVQDFVDRMLSELKKREFKNVFMNKCWSNDTFIDTFKATVRGTIEEETSQINHAVLDIFTEPQQFNEGIYSELKQIIERNSASVLSWYFIALILLNLQGITALHWIAAFGYSKLFTYIWGSLCSFQKATVGNMIPLLHFACLGGEIEIFNLILPDETDKVNMPLTAEIKLYPLHLSVYHNEDIILSLIKLGADINQKDLFHRPALFYTAGCKNTKICSILIHHDNKSGPCKYCRYINKIYNKNKCNIQSVSIENTEFNLNQTDIFGSSPLFLATSVNSINVANLLIQHHADTNLCDKDGVSPLCIAAQNNSIDVAELLLQHHADINLCSKGGFSPLYIAAQNNSIDVAELLIQHHADTNLCNKVGFSPLCIAAQFNSIDVAELLLQYHADINLCSKDGFSPLYIAAQNNSIDVAALLLQHHADTNLCSKDGFSPLYIAAQYNSIDVAELLLQYHADINLCSKDGFSPLHIAARNNSIDVAALLLQHHADTNLCSKDGFSPLHMAAWNNSIDVAELLLQHHADTNLCSKDGLSPLHVATKDNSIDVAELLLQHHADTNLCSKDGFSPLYIAAKNNSIDVANLLLQHHADNNLCNKGSFSPLHIAAQNNSIDVANLLIQHHADNNLCNKGSFSPLHVAAQNNSIDVANLLIQHHADVNLCSKGGFSPLFIAALFNSIDVANLLIQHHADINLCSKDGFSPLFIAALFNSIDVANLLIQHHADINLCSKGGFSPLFIAALFNSIDVAKLLLQHNADQNLCHEGKSPLDIAIEFKSTDVAELLSNY